MNIDDEHWTEEQVAAYGRRIMEAPRVRYFPRLGWTIVVLPLDVYESRMVARMGFGTWHGFKPDEVIDLRARRLKLDDDDHERTYWVLAITCEGMMRRKAEIEEALGSKLPDGPAFLSVLQVKARHLLEQEDAR